MTASAWRFESVSFSAALRHLSMHGPTFRRPRHDSFAVEFRAAVESLLTVL